jgi:D-alanine-D-alanine ligase
MTNKKVILLADIYDSHSGLDSKWKQEWESQESIDFLCKVIREIGYEVELIQAFESDKFLEYLNKKNQEEIILFNLIEGFNSRNREAYIPSIAEYFCVSYTGSDAYSQILSLDKYLMKKSLEEIFIPQKKSILIQSIEELSKISFFPCFVKPNSEGSSLGVNESSFCKNKIELKEKVIELLSQFQEVLVEEFLEGSDLTIGIIGNYPEYKITSVARIMYPAQFYDQNVKSKTEMPETLHFDLDKDLEKKIQNDSLKIALKIKLDGYARMDWKLDHLGNPFFLEANLTPGLSKFYSSLPICYQKSFGSYADLILEILELAQSKSQKQDFNYPSYMQKKY